MKIHECANELICIYENKVKGFYSIPTSSIYVELINLLYGMCCRHSIMSEVVMETVRFLYTPNEFLPIC